MYISREEVSITTSCKIFKIKNSSTKFVKNNQISKNLILKLIIFVINSNRPINCTQRNGLTMSDSSQVLIPQKQNKKKSAPL